MKLNEYLYEKIYAESRKMFQDEECEPLSADIIEQWIIEWYNESFKEIGCDELYLRLECLLCGWLTGESLKEV